MRLTRLDSRETIYVITDGSKPFSRGPHSETFPGGACALDEAAHPRPTPLEEAGEIENSVVVLQENPETA